MDMIGHHDRKPGMPAAGSPPMFDGFQNGGGQQRIGKRTDSACIGSGDAVMAPVDADCEKEGRADDERRDGSGRIVGQTMTDGIIAHGREHSKIEGKREEGGGGLGEAALPWTGYR